MIAAVEVRRLAVEEVEAARDGGGDTSSDAGSDTPFPLDDAGEGEAFPLDGPRDDRPL